MKTIEINEPIGDSPEDLKLQAGDIPGNSCPDIDKLRDAIGSVISDLAYVKKSRRDYTEDELKDIIGEAEWDLDRDIDKLEDLRAANEKLRELGKFWYESYCELYMLVNGKPTAEALLESLKINHDKE